MLLNSEPAWLSIELTGLTLAKFRIQPFFSQNQQDKFTSVCMQPTTIPSSTPLLTGLSAEAKNLIIEILSFCQAHSDEKFVRKYAIYFREGTSEYDAYGVDPQLTVGKVKELSGRKEITIDLLLEAAPELLKSGKQEEAMFLLLLVEKNLKQLEAHHYANISKWFEVGIINWAQCDMLCAKILPWFFLKKMVPLSNLAEWQKSPFRFQRRAIAVPLIKLLKSTDDYSQFFELITPLMMDTERVVHQGLGWFLRESWKKQPAQTEEFLMGWKDQSARLIFQYATEKMTKEQRLRFRKSK